MKHVRQIADKWRVRFYDARREPKEVSFSFDVEAYTRRDIERTRDELRYLWQKGEWDPWSRRLPAEIDRGRQTLTVQAATEQYCAHKRELGRRRQKGGWNAKTHANYEIDFAAWSASIEGDKLRVVDLETKHLEDWLYAKRDGAATAESTASTRRRMLSTFVRWLEAEDHIREDALKLPRAFVERRRIPQYVTRDELEEICQAHEELCRERAREKHVPKSGANSPLAWLWMSDAFRFAFYQGLRRGELLALRAGAVDLEGRRMVVGDESFIPKGKDERIITLTPPARSIIEPYLEDLKRTDRIFGIERRGKRGRGFDSPGRLTAAFKAAAERAVPQKPVHFHDLRVSCCVYWLERDVPLRDVRDLLRHKSIRTTERYYMTLVVKGQTERFEKAWEADLMRSARENPPAEKPDTGK